ncbi:zeta toxin family protein [Streptomyces sp. WMMB303]|uniref:zeta toxin family protein n=1 Tax=Streptomyces sp. WMMB303 TaxID=3034154 RepID=UPI0023EB7FE5|nr:zeta toxin family protein [Streptomyces sp. WMMB303]MDF4254553.1 zeta toxin family protein [Streptomyces sp. WMMB303]
MAGEENERVGSLFFPQDYAGQLLGELWFQPERIPEVLGKLTPEDFGNPSDGEIFRALVQTHEEHPAPARDEFVEGWWARRGDLVREHLEEAGVRLSHLEGVQDVSLQVPLSSCVEALTRQAATRRAVQEHNARAHPDVSLDKAGDTVDRALPPQPSYPQPPADPPDQPVVAVVAGAEGSGTGGVSLLVHEQLARRGPVVHLGHEYQADHPAYQTIIQESGARGPEERHLVAAQHTIERGANAVLHTDARDPQALAADLERFQQAGYRVEFAAVATPEAMRKLNSLETQLIGRRSVRQVTELAPNRLGECADRAAAMGANVRVFRPDGTAVASAALRDGKQSPSQVVAGVAGREWDSKTGLRAAAKAARLAARTTNPQVQMVIQEAALEAGRQHAGDWRWTMEAAVRLPEESKGPRWGAGRRARAAGPLAASTDLELESMLESGMQRYQKAQQDAYSAYKQGDELSKQNKPKEAQRFYDKSQEAQERAQASKGLVIDILGEERRRAGLSPGQRQAELQASARRASRVQPPPAARTGIGVAPPPRVKAPVRG